MIPQGETGGSISGKTWHKDFYALNTPDTMNVVCGQRLGIKRKAKAN